MQTDIQIAQSAQLKSIEEIAHQAGIQTEALIPYGKYKAKVDFASLPDMLARPSGRLVLVTATTPTAAGEGKITTTIGLSKEKNIVFY